MDHLAILDIKRRLLKKILSGEKIIESRWYVHKKTPYHKIKKGEIIFFKEAGKPVTVKAKASQILFFENLTYLKIKSILGTYGKRIGFNKGSQKMALEKNKNKKYCTLVFLEQVEEIRPFDIDKSGYGLMSAWITIDNIQKIKK